MQIWKETLMVANEQEIMVPNGAELLCAREQREQICIWFICDPQRPKEPRCISVIPTGGNVPAWSHRYIGTASLMNGGLIFHVFERADG